MWPLDSLPPPPVPQRLREMLKDYPGLLQELQDGLNKVITDPVKGTPPFEIAIWVLEDGLESFIVEARGELDAATASGDQATIEKAEDKLRLMFRARSSGGGMNNLSEVRRYFDTYASSRCWLRLVCRETQWMACS